jgi:hypothetical protein
LSIGLFWDPFCYFSTRRALLYAYTINNCVELMHSDSSYDLYITGAYFLVWMTY